MAQQKNICFIDFETTGIDIYKDEPIEIGALVVDGELNIINKFYSRISLPNNAIIDNSAFDIHGIKYSDLYESPSQENVINLFFESMGTDYCFASWNISFDVGFFKKICYYNNMIDTFNKINYRHIDVQSISQVANRLNIFNKEVNSLSECVNYFSLKRKKYHNAYEDALLCKEVYENIINKIQAMI
ncbi:3'-5' exonuclease [Hymenobacter yonginensis]|uniref:3'-5' exonuclease n=1 Tax=Hymenobacter yonginensis TaxID=748197 RepID=A0ABY7PLR7_9BACT|nr:3'-5' exonuclease [Hymenobacter yonginensis]WBO83649.1 3'-5' exonuclease [Hymenobacter yonginensis]